MDELVDAIMLMDNRRVDRLLRAGMSVNTIVEGHAPLQWAAVAGNLEAVRSLIQYGANPNLVDSPGAMTPLHFAACVSTEMVELLCAAGARLNERNDVGMTPVMVAAKGGHLDIVTCLVGHGADLRIYDNHGHGPLHWSAIGGNFTNLNIYLIEAGADPAAVTAYGKSYLGIVDTLARSSASARSTRRPLS